MKIENVATLHNIIAIDYAKPPGRRLTPSLELEIGKNKIYKRARHVVLDYIKSVKHDESIVLTTL